MKKMFYNLEASLRQTVTIPKKRLDVNSAPDKEG